MALSDLIIRQAKAAAKTYNLSDTDGLGLVVSPVGGKSWHLRYYWIGKQKRISLGNYPEISLREARTLRDEARALLAKGINPHVERKQKRHAIQLASEYTFQAVFNTWVDHRRKELKEGRQSTLSQILRIFGNDVLPSLGRKSIYEIRRPQLLGVLARIEERKAYTTAEKVRTWFGQLFRYALVVAEGMEANPATDLDVVAAPKPPVAHNPFLRLHELPEMLQTLRLYKGRSLQTQLGIRLLMLTGVRTGELRLATPDQFNLEHGLWIIPPEIVKQLQDEMRKAGKRPQDIPPYIVPLSLQAIEIIQHLLERVKPAQRYLLAHRSDLKKRISENTLNSALRRMGYEDKLTGHGIRATISTALNEMGYPKIWVDAQLSHSDPDKVSTSYNHAEYVEPRRRMMQDWADRLDFLEQGHVEAASAHLTIRIEGVPALENNKSASDTTIAHAPASVQTTLETPILVTTTNYGATFQRLSPLPLPTVQTQASAPEVSSIQREREEMLAIYEAPDNLPVPLFAKLAGKSKDQINRELKAGKLLSISLGNRGQRIPEWQLVPLKLKLAQVLLKQCPDTDSWELYHLLTKPHAGLSNRAAIDTVTPTNLSTVLQAITSTQQPPHGLEDDLPQFSEHAPQNAQRLMDSPAALEVA